jgi:RNA polymerase sigma factor (sigma-70 family)
MEVTLQSNQQKISFSALQLVEGLRCEGDSKSIRLFQNQFFQNYKGYIYKVAIQRCVCFHDPQQFAIDIVQQTFINAFQKIKNFNLSKEPNQEKHEVIIKAWLGRIANNCFNKEYAKRKNYLFLDDLKIKPEEGHYDIFESLYGVEPIEVPSQFRIKLNEAMKFLTEEQKHILLTYAGEGCINSNQHLSQEAMLSLCKIYDTSSANIRQIKKRTLDKVKKHCFQTSK